MASIFPTSPGQFQHCFLRPPACGVPPPQSLPLWMKPNKLALIHPVVSAVSVHAPWCWVASRLHVLHLLWTASHTLFHPFINGIDLVPHACAFLLLLLHIFDSHRNTLSLFPSISVCAHLLNAMRHKINEGINRELDTPSPRFHEHPKIKEAHRPPPVQVNTLTFKPLTFSTVLNIIYHHGPCQNEWIIKAMTCFYCFTVNKHLKHAAPPGSSEPTGSTSAWSSWLGSQVASYLAPVAHLFCFPSC